jgi:hypothetical protein
MAAFLQLRGIPGGTPNITFAELFYEEEKKAQTLTDLNSGVEPASFSNLFLAYRWSVWLNWMQTHESYDYDGISRMLVVHGCNPPFH